MKAYRFKAVYNDSSLFEFHVSESSDLDSLAQNLCNSMQVEYDRDRIFMFTKKKGRNWDATSQVDEDQFADELKSMQFRAGKKIFIKFDDDCSEGIEIHFLEKSNDLQSDFAVVSKPKKLTATQMKKLSLKPAGKSSKKLSKKSKKTEPEPTPVEEEEDFADDEMDEDEDSLNLTDADFERDYAEEEDDLDESGIFDAEEIENIDDIEDDLEDDLDIDDEDYIDEEDEYYQEDDEDFIEKYDDDDEDDDDDYYSDYDDDDDDDDDDYYDDDEDYDDDDKY